jgi:hypothetical protein
MWTSLGLLDSLGNVLKSYAIYGNCGKRYTIPAMSWLTLVVDLSLFGEKR